PPSQPETTSAMLASHERQYGSVPPAPSARRQKLTAHTPTITRFRPKCMAARRRARDSCTDRTSVDPGTAASDAPMTPPPIVSQAVVSQSGLPVDRYTMSATSEKTHNPIGIDTSIG